MTMHETFRALIADEIDGKPRVAVVPLTGADLPDGDVTVAVAYSSLNYKDGLTLTGALPIIQRYPMYGLGETHWGGYTQRQRLRSEWLAPVPDTFTLDQAMAIGTAGYTAMLCVMVLEEADIVPDSGDVVVTGAGGGVGSIAVALLARLGYQVTASTGRPALEPYLRSLGAARIVGLAELTRPPAPLEEERWAGAIDTVAGSTLAPCSRRPATAEQSPPRAWRAASS
jgi:acrylyl-CoA reductase (NADPH)